MASEQDITESAHAVMIMRKSEDLDARMAELRTRQDGGEGGNFANVCVVALAVPDGYTPDDMKIFEARITQVLAGIVKEAADEVRFARTWNSIEN